MPRKTRKEKKVAAQHNKLRFLSDTKQSITISLPDSTDIKKSSPPSFLKESNKPNTQLAQEELHMRTFFLTDFRKSMVFITAIIALEICLYFASINH